MIGKIVDVINLIFPKRCPGCDKILNIKEYDRGFCNRCLQKIHIIGDNYCIKCGRELDNEIEEYCNDCKRKKRYFTMGRSVYSYSGPIKNAMYGFKYGNKRAYARVFFSDIERYLSGFIEYISADGPIDAVLPVPVSKKRYLKRGYNQAYVLAYYIARNFNLPLYKNIVSRMAQTKALKNQNLLERQINLIHAFKYTKISVKLNKILLIDDIYTTGTTINSIAKELNKNGICKIYFICVCSGNTQ